MQTKAKEKWVVKFWYSVLSVEAFDAHLVQKSSWVKENTYGRITDGTDEETERMSKEVKGHEIHPVQLQCAIWMSKRLVQVILGLVTPDTTLHSKYTESLVGLSDKVYI